MRHRRRHRREASRAKAPRSALSGHRSEHRNRRPWKVALRSWPIERLANGTLVRLNSDPYKSYDVEAWPLGANANTLLLPETIGIVVGSPSDYSFLHTNEYAVSISGTLYALYRYQLRRVRR